MSASATSPEYHAPFYAYLVCAVTSIVLYFAAVSCDRHRYYILTAVIALFSSFGLMTIARTLIEHQSLGKLFDPTLASKAFFPGDLGLSVMVLIAGYVRAQPTWNGRGTHGSWAVTAYVLGWLLASIFHFLLDGPNYRKQGGAALLVSPSKLTHDLITYSVLGAIVVYVALPVLFSHLAFQSLYWWLMLASGLVWVVGVGLDSVPGALNIYDLHPTYSWTQHRVTSFARR